ncbi:MAG: hypothetical protein ACHP7K_04965 [Actinomycetales bacterium]|jgi:hypothetical protein
MTVPSKDFQQWLHAALPGESTAEISRRTGIKRTTLTQQMVRGRITVSNVVRISRAYGLDVIASLAAFDDFRDLEAGLQPPTRAESLSQVSDLDLLREILARNSGHVPGISVPVLEPVPHAGAVKCWIDAVGDGGLRQGISRRMDMAPQNLSAQISANRLAPRYALEAARLAGVGLANGLVASGLLTPEEAGWPPLARESAVGALADSELVALAATRLDALGRTLRRAEHDNDDARALWENLG